jgi:histidinol phosphatase-like enzyme
MGKNEGGNGFNDVMIYAFDLDGTLCTETKNQQYHEAEPNIPMIRLVNQLYNEGNTIKIFTARGQFSGEDFTEITEKQLKEWGVKYHSLHWKTAAHIYIDDRAIHPQQFLRCIGGTGE